MSQFDRIEQSQIEKIAKKVVAASGGGGGSGTVTQVNSGTGLTGGPITTTGTLSVSFGTSGTTACVGNDARLSDSRTPTAHTHPQSDITNLVTDLSNKAALSHTHAQADVTNLVTDLAAKAPVGSQYVTLATDATLTNERVATAGSHVTLTDAGAGGALTFDWDPNPGKIVVIETDCVATGALLAQGSGTSAAINYTTSGLSSGNRIGVGRCSTGSTNVGRYGLGSATADTVVLGSNPVVFTTIVNILTLSTVGETFLVQCGLFDSTSGTPTDGLYFEYTHSVFGGNWQANIYNNGGSIGSNDTAITVAAGTWYKLEVVVNAAASQTLFKIDGVTKYTHTGTTPNGTARAMGFYSQIRKTAGTTARNLDIDYIGYKSIVTR